MSRKTNKKYTNKSRKTKSRKTKSRKIKNLATSKLKTRKSSLKGGRNPCDNIAGRCTYRSDRRVGYRGRYTAHETICPDRAGRRTCKHITITDDWYPPRRWHFGSKRSWGETYWNDRWGRWVSTGCNCQGQVEPRWEEFDDEDQAYEVYGIYNDLRGQADWGDQGITQATGRGYGDHGYYDPSRYDY